MPFRQSRPVIQQGMEYWNEEVLRHEASVKDAEENLIRVGWDLATPAQVIRYWSLELGKRRKKWGYAKHRLSRLIQQEQELQNLK